MDLESGKQHIIAAVRKYQYVILVVLVGACFMLLPERTEEPQEDIQTTQILQPDLEVELSEILSNVSGVGKAVVLLSEASGSDTIYQVDTTQNQSNLDTVIVRDGSREEAGLIKQVLPPVYRGAIVVCQGADSAAVRLAVVDAVKSVTGLSSDCIIVLKMK